MQNVNNTSYINKNKIINIKSEVLFREAEDDLFYFNKINSAFKKLKTALELTPYHYKSIVMYADICFMKGYIKKALRYYLKAGEILQSDAKVQAAICNCYNIMKDYKNALKYCKKAITLLNYQNFSLLSQLIEIKINILVSQKKYKQAYITFIQAQNILDNNSLNIIYNENYNLINEKIKLQKKLLHSHLKIV